MPARCRRGAEAERAGSNRRFLGRAIRYLTGLGVRQFLDLRAGPPTRGNASTAIVRAGLRDPDAVLGDPDVRRRRRRRRQGVGAAGRNLSRAAATRAGCSRDIMWGAPGSSR
ncbi:SAM-dependent methyltransferase [Actinomadura parmotrematis]|uniref:SAM-dependent methyltransferase n=1 Tax=Actinomadura parmotrematis TaxID=2864039 RepID=A0ABS7FPS7_9ACTN|nr:SAM-dependent methyltransferase [Actinomadura parmotrematis]MBW8482230.1 SAM-dependent methyltransferase [Actinomadura parmotrematis]